MKPRILRILLILAVLMSSAFAAWSWLRPYAWGVDPAARCKVAGVQVTPDQSYFWVHVHLKMTPGAEHDMRKPVYLITGDGAELQPADTTFAGTKSGGTTDLWLKFWLEPDHISGTLNLRINDGNLSLKSTQGIPAEAAYFTSNHW